METPADTETTARPVIHTVYFPLVFAPVNGDVLVKRSDGRLCAVVLDDYDRQQVRPIEEC